MRNSLVLRLSLEHWSRGERGAYEGIHAIIMPKTALTSGQRTNEGQRVGRKHSECTCSTFFRSSWRVALRTFRFERGLHGIGLLASLSLAPVQRGWKGGRVAKPFPQLLSLHALEPNGAFSSSLAFAHFFTNVRECCTRIAWNAFVALCWRA